MSIREKRKNLLLAPNEQVMYSDIKFPVYASPKLDGVRAVCYEGEFFSRSWKVFGTAVNVKFWQIAQKARRQGLIFDGEIYSPEMDFSQLMSALKPSAEHLPDSVKYYVFDCLTEKTWKNGGANSFTDRNNFYNFWIADNTPSFVEPVKHSLIYNSEELEEYFDSVVSKGYEGMITRSPRGGYKHGRATLNEAIIHKFKKHATVDAVIVGFEQATQMKPVVQHGKREKDEMGYLKRTHKKGERRKIAEIGSYVVKLKNGVTCKVNLAKDVTLGVSWDNRDKLMGKHVEVIYMDHGIKDKPRFGRIVRLRPDLDR